MVSSSAPATTLTLADLSVGDRATVVGFRVRDEDPNSYANKLVRMGLIPGTTFEVLRRAPLGDPLEIQFRGFALALRPAEAGDLIVVRA